MRRTTHPSASPPKHALLVALIGLGCFCLTLLSAHLFLTPAQPDPTAAGPESQRPPNTTNLDPASPEPPPPPPTVVLQNASKNPGKPLDSNARSKPRSPANPADQEEPLRLTIPDLARVKDVPVTTAADDDQEALDAGALHVRGTGLPSKKGANVFVAGHRIGYRGTGSYRLFFDLADLTNGDEVFVKDPDGLTYVYSVYEREKVSPQEVFVTKPIPGKSIVSLQTCTLPAYRMRLIVRAQLTDVR